MEKNNKPMEKKQQICIALLPKMSDYSVIQNYK